MFGRGLSGLVCSLLEMSHWNPSWPHRIVHDAAHLFIPFAFVVFLLLLGAALLITWGRFSDGVLVGFCVSAGILIAFFVICHLALYCTWAREATDAEKRGEDSSAGSPVGNFLRAQSPRICADCRVRLETQGLAPPQGRGPSRREVRVEGVPDADELRLRPQSEQVSLPPQRSPARNHASRPFSFEPAHPSMIPLPLNLSRMQRDSQNGIIPFQVPVYMEHHSAVGAPGLRVPISLCPGQDQRPAIVESRSLPANLSDVPPGHDVPPPQREAAGRSLTRRVPRQPVFGSASTPTRGRPIQRVNATAEVVAPEQLQQATSKGSLESPRKKPRGPRPQLSRVPRSMEDAQTISGNRAERLPQIGAATSGRSRETLSGQSKDAPSWFEHSVPPLQSPRAHMVLIQEPDLIDLVDRGVIKWKDKSTPPDWPMSKPIRSSTSLRQEDGGAHICDNTHRRTAELHGSPDHVQRTRSHRIQVVGRCSKGCSGDSGYCTASSSVPQSASLPGERGEIPEMETSEWRRLVWPFIGSKRSSASSGDTIQRLLSAFNNGPQQDESRQSSVDSYREDLREPKMMAEIMSMTRRQGGTGVSGGYADSLCNTHGF